MSGRHFIAAANQGFGAVAIPGLHGEGFWRHNSAGVLRANGFIIVGRHLVKKPEASKPRRSAGECAAAPQDVDFRT